MLIKHIGHLHGTFPPRNVKCQTSQCKPLRRCTRETASIPMHFSYSACTHLCQRSVPTGKTGPSPTSAHLPKQIQFDPHKKKVNKFQVLITAYLQKFFYVFVIVSEVAWLEVLRVPLSMTLSGHNKVCSLLAGYSIDCTRHHELQCVSIAPYEHISVTK